MPRIYAEQKPRGPNHARLELASDRAKERAQILLDAPHPPPFVVDGYRITIESKELVGRQLKIIASAMRGGEVIKVNNPLYYLNPPSMVQDGTFRKVPNMALGGWDDTANYHEDASAALKEIVAETVITYHKTH
jgi:hypothetical protein